MSIIQDRCEAKLHALDLYNDIYKDRLHKEIKIIEAQNMSQYFLNCVDKVKETGKIKNSNHTLIAFLLGITDENPLETNLELIKTKYEEFPDIDSDFEDIKRDTVKDYLIDKYGKDNVATIIAFGKAKARNTIKDIGRVKGIPFEDINQITKFFKTGPDEDTIEKAYKNYPEVRAFFDKYSYLNLLKLCLKLEGNVRQASKHASGFVISPVPLTDVVGLMLTKGVTVTCWEEGLETKELSKIGLVKIDMLGLNTLTVISDTLKYIKDKHGKDINLEMVDLKDVKVLEQFYQGNSIGIFQFEKDKLRHLMKQIKINNFSDISAINALNRPGPLDTGMDEVFWKVKNKLQPEKYLHQSLEPILKDTYTVILYQEQIIKVAQMLAGFNADEADNLRRILTKDAQAGRSKGINPLEKLEKDFIQRCMNNGVVGRVKATRNIYDSIEIPSTAQDVQYLAQKVDKSGEHYNEISCTVEISDEIFYQIKSFSNYGFNKCLVGSTKVKFKNFKSMKIDTIFKNKNQVLGILPNVMSFDSNASEINENRIVDITESGVQDVFLLTTRSKKKLICTGNHKIRTLNGWKELGDIGMNDKILILKGGALIWDEILTISYKGKQMTYDVSLQDQTHPYFFANNIAVHNSHSVSYAYLAFESMYLKTYYPKEFMSMLLTHTPNVLEKKTQENDFINYMEETKRLGIEVFPTDINKSEREFQIEGEAIRSGFVFVKGVADRAIQNILKNRPFKSVRDFLTRTDGRAINKTVFHALVNSGSFDCFLTPTDTIQDRFHFINEYNTIRKNKTFESRPTLEKAIASEAEVCGGEIFNSQFSMYNIKKINEKFSVDDKIMDFKVLDRVGVNNTVRIFGRIEKYFQKNAGFLDVRNGNDKKSFVLWKTDLEFLEENKQIKDLIKVGSVITFKAKRSKDYNEKKSFNILPDSIEKIES